MKIFLIGFMGCGKSYLGKKLAALLNFQFIDVDSVIQNTHGETVQNIFEKQGETYFRKIESDALQNLKKWDEVVIATGGGAPCFHNNMAWMNANGVTIYLKTDPHLLFERLKSETDHRPVLGGKTDAALLDFINDKVTEREQFYNKAQIIVDQSGNGNEIVFTILEQILSRPMSN